MTTIENIKKFFDDRCEAYRKNAEKSVFLTDCDVIEYMLDHCELYVLPESKFFVGVNLVGVREHFRATRRTPLLSLKQREDIAAGLGAFAFDGYYDFGHTSAEWESVISLGIFGLRERILQYAASATNGKSASFYQGLIKVFDAALRFMKRCAAFAREQGLTQMAQGLDALSTREPQTLYEAMQTSLVYYALQQYFEMTYLRTMGRVDRLFYPYFVKEDRESAKALIVDYLKALDEVRASANLPFALGGSDGSGNCLINELSYLFLEAYGALETSHVKLHLLCPQNVPHRFLVLAFDMIRRGKNSIVFFADECVIRSLMHIGVSLEDATDYHVVGCYECGGKGELPCSCNAKVNIVKALEYALNGGVDLLTGEQVGVTPARQLADYSSFEELLAEFDRQLCCLCDGARRATDAWEAHNAEQHAAPFLSATYTAALENGGDLYSHNSAKYNNSSIAAMGLATAVDSLLAVRELVFVGRRYTLAELLDILKKDWQGHEPLRLWCQNKLPKFGDGSPEAGGIAKHIVDVLDGAVNGVPNQKGGVYRLALFSIDWRWEYGEHTAATPDGRKKGDPISQNTSATFGMDREGATAHLLSVASLDGTRMPDGGVVDIDLHASAVRGEEGMQALIASLLTYMRLGGYAVHYNVLDERTLIDAREHPEKYPNLQVRLCGWNVRFSELSDKEKEEFIRRAAR